MKKIITMAVAVLLVSGAAFAGGKKCEGKTCSKEKSTKEKKADKPAPPAEAKKG
jgi:hypothetical protein